jgi:hypothetical protein
LKLLVEAEVTASLATERRETDPTPRPERRIHMLKRSLSLVALSIAVAGPLSAQGAWQWDAERPDALQITAVEGASLVPRGSFMVQYTFGQESLDGLRFGSDEVALLDVLDLYAISPFERRNRSNRVQLAYGLTDFLTIRAAGSFLEFDRDVVDEFDNELFLLTTENDGIGDIEVEAMVKAYESASVRSLVSLGVELPTGTIDAEGDNLATGGQTTLPYNMQLGTGSIAIVPGVTAQTQNEFGTVGLQVKARLRLNNNDREYRYGDEVQASFWGAYAIADQIAIGSGVRAYRFAGIDGFDPWLDPGRDPAEDVVLSAATRVSIPLSLNVVLDEGLLAGNAFSFEFDWPVYENFDSFALSTERTFRITWNRTFGLF